MKAAEWRERKVVTDLDTEAMLHDLAACEADRDDLRRKLEERLVGAGYTLAEVRERERKAFVAGAAAWQVRLQNGAFIGGADLQTWAEAEALRRYKEA